MKRFDLRPLKDNFYDRMFELMNSDIKEDENAIFLFEIGDFSPIQKVADLLKENEYTLMNSLKFNEVDWTVVIKKTKPAIIAVAEEDKIEEDAKASSES
jgi:NADH-quinone oxidoreductase subunit E